MCGLRDQEDGGDAWGGETNDVPPSPGLCSGDLAALLRTSGHLVDEAGPLGVTGYLREGQWALDHRDPHGGCIALDPI